MSPVGASSVTIRIADPNGRTSNFAATAGSNSVWSVTVQGFTAGSWTWQVIAKDTVRGILDQIAALRSGGEQVAAQGRFFVAAAVVFGRHYIVGGNLVGIALAGGGEQQATGKAGIGQGAEGKGTHGEV